MIAKVITQDGRVYDSHIFARIGEGWKRMAVTFDDQSQTFDCTPEYQNTPYLIRRVFVVDAENEDWIEKTPLEEIGGQAGPIAGQAWLIENQDLLAKILSGAPAEERYLCMAKERNASIERSEWTFVKDEKDAESLMAAAWGFHDAVIRSVTYHDDDGTAPMVEVVFGH